MDELTPELRERFLQFRSVYQFHYGRLEASGAQGAVIAQDSWTLSLAEVRLEPDELKLYKKLVAMHSVNGGELFQLAQPDDHTE